MIHESRMIRFGGQPTTRERFETNMYPAGDVLLPGSDDDNAGAIDEGGEPGGAVRPTATKR